MAGREYHRTYYHKRKAELVAMLGGKCVRCGVTERLTFDHVDAGAKAFSITKFLGYSWARVVDELKKCQLLCFDCHDAKSAQSSDGMFRLKPEQVEEVRCLLLQGVAQGVIAKQFGVHQATVSRIKSNKRWKRGRVVYCP